VRPRHNDGRNSHHFFGTVTASNSESEDQKFESLRVLIDFKLLRKDYRSKKIIRMVFFD